MNEQLVRQLTQMKAYLNSAVSRLERYEAIKETVLADAPHDIQADLIKDDHYVSECLDRLRTLIQTIENAESRAEDYSDFMNGLHLPVIYGPPEVMGLSPRSTNKE